MGTDSPLVEEMGGAFSELHAAPLTIALEECTSLEEQEKIASNSVSAPAIGLTRATAQGVLEFSCPCQKPKADQESELCHALQEPDRAEAAKSPHHQGFTGFKKSSTWPLGLQQAFRYLLKGT